jgi:hypothetical protein
LFKKVATCFDETPHSEHRANFNDERRPPLRKNAKATFSTRPSLSPEDDRAAVAERRKSSKIMGKSG